MFAFACHGQIVGRMRDNYSRLIFIDTSLVKRNWPHKSSLWKTNVKALLAFDIISEVEIIFETFLKLN